MAGRDLVAKAPYVLGSGEMAFKHGHELTRAVRTLFSAGKADLAVAYWGNDACARLDLPARLEGFRIACDAYSGFCSPHTLEKLLGRGAQIVSVPKLHAKVYLTETAMVVASANASLRGLSLDELAGHGLEAGIAETDPVRLADAKTWFEKVFASGTSITTQDLDAISALWKHQRASRMMPTTLVEAILSGSETLIDRRLRVHLYTAAAPSAAVQRAYKETPYYDSTRWEHEDDSLFFWGEVSSSINLQGELLCFEFDGGKASCEGVWNILGKIEAKNSVIWPAQLVPMPLGQNLGPTDELDRRVTAAIHEGRLILDGEPIALDKFVASVSDRAVEERLLAQIQSADTRAAFAHLLEQSKSLGLTKSYDFSAVPAVRWHDAYGRYVFSFIPNKGHLLFYVRRPALDAVPELADQAQRLGLASNVNQKNETTLHISTEADATVVTQWLKSILPLR